MQTLRVLAAALVLVAGAARASEHSDVATAHLYAGTAAEGIADAQEACDMAVQDACFGLGLLRLVTAYERLAQDLYRYGAVMPDNAAIGLYFGMGSTGAPAPANSAPEHLTYSALREVLEDFVLGLDAAGATFERASGPGEYLVTIDPLKIVLDLNGDGQATEGETLGAILASAGEFTNLPAPDEVPLEGKTKKKGAASEPNTSIGFDRADAVWFQGYTQVAAAPFDLLLAHDFENFFDAYLHRVFPKAGLPMQEHNEGGGLFMDEGGEAGVADLVAAIHTINFPVVDRERLANVLNRLRTITALSRQNWELILAETDDNRELVPSPEQTSLVETLPVTKEVVDAWLATLDTVDQVLDGKLLVPHWRFEKGFDFKAYFETAERTDLVMLLTGSAALPYLREGPIADASSFAKANRALGADWLNYAFWFN